MPRLPYVFLLSRCFTWESWSTYYSKSFPFLLFQNIFHHIFMRGLSDISGHVVASDLYSIEFTTQKVHRCMSIRFWENDILTRVELYRHHQGEVYPDCYLTEISHLLSFISPKPSLVSVSGCSSMVFRALETSGFFKNGIQYTHSDLKPFPCQSFCTRMSYRPSMSWAELTCSRSSNTWLSSYEGARGNLGPFSVQNFARLLSYLIFPQSDLSFSIIYTCSCYFSTPWV